MVPPASPSSIVPASVGSRRERSLVPEGMTTILPHTARRVRRLEEILLSQLERWGYEEIILPTFEYLDVLAPGLEPAVIEQCFQFVDRTTGRILLLRPDATAQIARTVAMGLTGSTVPLRLSYRTAVFRYEPEHAGRDREIFQVGAELIGAQDASSDSEIIALMVQCLQRVGLPSLKVSLGHVGFFKHLLARSGMSADAQKRAEQAAARRDLPRLEEIVAAERVPRPTARGILAAPGLCGGEEVLEQGRRLAGRDASLREPLDRLEKVYELLVSAGLKDDLLLDLGEFRGFEYYDGVVFDVFAEGVGSELGGGGRYDHLIGRFGRELPSTGFALDVDRLFRAMALPGDGAIHARADYLVSAPSHLAHRVVELATRLRESGCRVIQGQVRHARTRLVQKAVEEARCQRAAAAVIVGAPDTRKDEVVVVENILDATSVRRGGRTQRSLPSKRVTVEWLANRVLERQDA